MTRLIFLTAGGTSMDVLSTLPDFGGRYEPVGYLDDAPAKKGTTLLGLPVVGTLAEHGRFPDVKFVNCLGSPASVSSRHAAVNAAGIADDRFETLVHPSAVVSPHSVVGPGTVVYPHVFIGAGVNIGKQVLVLSHASINHGVDVGDHTIVASSAVLLGEVRVGAAAYVGAAASIRQGVSVGARTIVGMGSVVLHDLPDGVVAVGVPAEVLRRLIQE